MEEESFVKKIYAFEKQYRVGHVKKLKPVTYQKEHLMWG